MFNPPFTVSIPIYIALGLLIVTLALLIGFVCKRAYILVRRLRHKSVSRTGIITGTIQLLLILLAVAFSAALLFFFAFIQSYIAFTHREHAATVYCAEVPGIKDKMTLEIVTFESPTVGRLRKYNLLGQQWAIEGHILKWDDWLNYLGLHTMYKLTRVRGRYLRADHEMIKPATVYSLVTNEDEPRWRWLYEYGARLPFVHAVYGNTVFTFPSETKFFHIYVTTSGFMIEESEEEER